jgi:hypothetical protein
MDEDQSDRGMPSLMKGKKDSTMIGGAKGGKGITPFMKKKENVEEKARIMELSVSLKLQFDTFKTLV